jgi:hypothetical protein
LRGSVLSTTNAQLQDAGLHLKQGDTQKEGAKLDPRLIEIAKLTQQNVPDFCIFQDLMINFIMKTCLLVDIQKD